MKARKVLSGILMIAGMVVFGSCKQSPTSNKGEQRESVEREVKKSEIKKEIGDIIYPLPTSFEVTEMLNRIEASYIFGITNEPENADKYFTADKQALNLGVYAADLAYANTYNFKQEMLSCFGALRTLVKELNMASVVNEKTIETIEANVDDKEKLVKVITDVFHRTYSFLQKNNEEELSYLFLAGTWVEGMHLTLNISDNTFDNVEIIKVIMEQENSLNKLIDVMEPVKGDETISDVYQQLSKIQDVYEKQEGASSLSRKQLEEISNLNENLREKIVE